jgi:hypothetical protein
MKRELKDYKDYRQGRHTAQRRAGEDKVKMMYNKDKARSNYDENQNRNIFQNIFLRLK